VEFGGTYPDGTDAEEQSFLDVFTPNRAEDLKGQEIYGRTTHHPHT